MEGTYGASTCDMSDVCQLLTGSRDHNFIKVVQSTQTRWKHENIKFHDQVEQTFFLFRFFLFFFVHPLSYFRINSPDKASPAKNLMNLKIVKHRKGSFVAFPNEFYF